MARRSRLVDWHGQMGEMKWDRDEKDRAVGRGAVATEKIHQPEQC